MVEMSLDSVTNHNFLDNDITCMQYSHTQVYNSDY